YYLGVLQRLWAGIRRVRAEYREPGSWFLLHDNAPSHKAIMAREFLTKKGIIVIDHSPYSPDLAPCDFWLFPKLKLAMKGNRFDTILVIQKTSTAILKAIPADEYKKCCEKFVERFQRCIDSEGDYFE
ncbi:Histone-lysine N-methyltransferase SETMAR, partial [Harpegnathos saltator]